MGVCLTVSSALGTHRSVWYQWRAKLQVTARYFVFLGPLPELFCCFISRLGTFIFWHWIGLNSQNTGWTERWNDKVVLLEHLIYHQEVFVVRELSFNSQPNCMLAELYLFRHRSQTKPAHTYPCCSQSGFPTVTAVTFGSNTLTC